MHHMRMFSEYERTHQAAANGIFFSKLPTFATSLFHYYCYLTIDTSFFNLLFGSLNLTRHPTGKVQLLQLMQPNQPKAFRTTRLMHFLSVKQKFVPICI